MKFLSYLLVFTLGLLISQTPDLIQLYNDHVMVKYRAATCDPRNHPESCDFFKWYDTYRNENPKLSELSSYFILGEGPVYMALSSKCSNHIFYNLNAAPKDSGKITNRNYFFGHCSRFAMDLSDLIFKDQDKEQDFEPSKEHF